MMEKLLFTGGTGYLGNNIRPILEKSYRITTVGITPADEIKANLASDEPDLTEHYDVVLHACGKAHSVPKTEAERQVFFDVNYQGTVNLCKALEKVGVPRAFVFISTLSVYGAKPGTGIDESHPLNGVSPYAKSKIMAEEYLQKWAAENGVVLGILRPSLMAGPNPPGNLGAMIKGISKGYYFNVGKGEARKSLLMVYDIAHLVPKVAEKGGVYNVCDDSPPSYKELGILMSKQLGVHRPLNMPMWMARILAAVGNHIRQIPFDSYRLKKLTDTYTYSNEKAKRELGWEPMDVLENFRVK